MMPVTWHRWTSMSSALSCQSRSPGKYDVGFGTQEKSVQLDQIVLSPSTSRRRGRIVTCDSTNVPKPQLKANRRRTGQCVVAAHAGKGETT